MKARYFVGLAVILFAAGILGLRQNNLEAAEIVSELKLRDARGEDVRSEIETELREFVFTHMNASSAIYLEGEHRRAEIAAQRASDEAVDGSVYDAAMEACDQAGRAPTENAECVQDYVASRTDVVDEVELPTVGEFTYVYYSPTWTPDLPGWSLLGASLSTLAAVIVYIRYWLRRLFT